MLPHSAIRSNSSPPWQSSYTKYTKAEPVSNEYHHVNYHVNTHHYHVNAHFVKVNLRPIQRNDVWMGHAALSTQFFHYSLHEVCCHDLQCYHGSICGRFGCEHCPMCTRAKNRTFSEYVCPVWRPINRFLALQR